MKKLRKTQITSLFLLLGIIVWITAVEGESLTESSVQSSTTPFIRKAGQIMRKTSQLPIYITSDADLSSFPGFGTSDSPYRIEDYNIAMTSSGCAISITGTTAYFLVNNNTLDGGSDAMGIFLSNNEHGTITNNTITKAVTGIYLSSANKMNIANNKISGGSQGINVIGNENTISGNSISDTLGNGIQVNGENNIVTENKAYRNEYHGAVINGINTVSDNMFYDNRHSGIRLRSNAKTIHNLIYDNNIGIEIEESGNTITNNTIYRHVGEGINCFPSSELNQIKWNDFGKNKPLGSSQAQDEGTSNIFSQNHWTDLISPDSDDDGIVDTSYSITGPANNKDKSPLINPTHITDPRVITPNGGESLKGVVTIEWEASVDSFGHTLSYSVFYSSNGGDSWELLNTTSSTSYQWDTDNATDSSKGFIRVTANDSVGFVAIDTSDKKFTVGTPKSTPGMSGLIAMLSLFGILLLNVRKRKKIG